VSIAAQGAALPFMARFFRFLFTTGLVWSSLGLHLVVCACYLRRWDKAAAITVYPFWAWTLTGIVLSAVAWIITRRRLPAVLTAVWTVTMFAGADEVRPLLRFGKEKPLPGRPAPMASGTVPLRIITLNCRAGMWNPQVLEELVPWAPDVVFLQEAPTRAELQKFTARLFPSPPGDFQGGNNCAILSRTQIFAPVSGYQPFSILGFIEPRPGKRIELACAHLAGAETSMRLWSRDAWRMHYYNRQRRMSELDAFLSVQQLFSGNYPIIVGGDFNAPAGDAVFGLLQRRGFTDAFAEAGSGWPDTYPNAAPVLRIDHLWMKDLTPVRATTVKTQRSDHRMIVCDFLLP
jgi:endonuclease/exonuclease/phosphatase (EEP) superfamily protein YafD